jgi:alanine dehydrogenase
MTGVERCPVVVTETMVEHMKGGAVIDVAIPEVALKLRSNIS